MEDAIFGMVRSVGQSMDTTHVDKRDNSHVNWNSSETVAIGDVGRTETDFDQGDARLLDAAEVAERLHVSQSLVYKMIERRKIPAIKIGRCVRIDPRALEEVLRSPDWAK